MVMTIWFMPRRVWSSNDDDGCGGLLDFRVAEEKMVGFLTVLVVQRYLILSGCYDTCLLQYSGLLLLEVNDMPISNQCLRSFRSLFPLQVLYP